MNMHRILLAALLVSLACSRGDLTAADFVDWSSATAGTVNAVSVSASYTNTTSLALSSDDYSGPEYDPAGSASQEEVQFLNRAGITWTFGSPVTDVGLYLKFWRGSNAAGPTDNTYTFSAAPTIKSGLANASVSGNSFLTVNTTDFYSGILMFPGPLTTLTLNVPNVNPTSNGLVLYTIAANVPEPSTYALGGIGALAIGILSRRRKSRVG